MSIPKGFKRSKTWNHIARVYKPNGKVIVYVNGEKITGDFTIDEWCKGLERKKNIKNNGERAINKLC